MRSIPRRLALQPGQGQVNTSPPSQQRPDNISEIKLLHSAGSKKSTERSQAAQISGHKNESRGLPVEAMHQAKLRAIVLESRNQGITLMRTQTGLTQQAGWLIDHQILRVLEHESTARELRNSCCQGIKA